MLRRTVEAFMRGPKHERRAREEERYEIERREAIDQCVTEYRAGNITMDTAQEIRYQVLHSFGVQKIGYEAVEAALRVAFSPEGDEAWRQARPLKV